MRRRPFRKREVWLRYGKICARKLVISRGAAWEKRSTCGWLPEKPRRTVADQEPLPFLKGEPIEPYYCGGLLWTASAFPASKRRYMSR